MSVIKVGAIQDLSGNTDVDLTNNIVYAATIKNSSSATNNLVLNSDGTVTSGNLTVTNVNGAPANRLVLMSAQASTSGTAIDFTGIPSWAKRITVMFNGVSTNGTSSILIQIGSGSVSTSGYASQVWASSSYSGVITTGFDIHVPTSGTQTFSGLSFLTLIGSNTWIQSGSIAYTNAASYSWTSAGNSPALPGALDRVRITTVNGTDTFDSGSINIMYEG